MLIGILSDTHGREDTARLAIAALQSRGAAFFIHCGDVCSDGVIDLLAGLPAGFVWGNCDFDRAGLKRYAEIIGVQCWGAFGDVELGGKRLAVLHGDDPKLKRRVLDAQEHDYLLQGHTHVREDARVGRTRVVNPGALHRASVKSVAVLDTAEDRVEFIEVA